MDKITCVIVDDDEQSREAMLVQCHALPYVVVAGVFGTQERFIESLPTLKFDVCLIGLNFYGKINGLKVAKQLSGQAVIFVTGNENMLADALKTSPIDIVLKPIEEPRFNDAMVKAYHLLNGQRQKHRNGKECELFKVDGFGGKVKFRLADILYVHSDKDDPRHKYVTTRDGNTNRIMDCKFDKLLAVAHNLVRINSSEVVSLELVKKFEHNSVIVEDYTAKDGVREYTLNRTFRKEFKERIAAW